jgi:hypothetical protein
MAERENQHDARNYSEKIKIEFLMKNWQLNKKAS